MNGGHDVAKHVAHGGQYPDLKEKSVAYMAGMAGFPTHTCLIIEAFRNFTNLMQAELQLAKAEMAENFPRAGTGIALIAVAGILALTGLSAGTSALFVGGGVLLIAVILVLVGKSRLSASALGPTRTVSNLQRHATTVKGATNVEFSPD